MSSLRDRYNYAGINAAGMDAAGMPRRTLKAAISCVGHGLHGGAEVHLNLLPAPSGHGIVFHRTDLDVKIPAVFDNVSDTRLCTILSAPGHAAAAIGTVEHLLAALSACRIDDVLVEVDAAELPIFDGSASAFLFLIESAGVVEHSGHRDCIEILRPVRVTRDNAFAELLPPDFGGGFELSLTIDFPAAAIGKQNLHINLTPGHFAAELANARTFTMAGEVEALRKAGLAKGGSLQNAIVVDGAMVLNPEGLRWNDEFVRHKMLDVVGDLALAGAAIRGKFSGYCTGHALNNLLLRTLFADAGNYRLIRGAPANTLQLAAA